jgi:hypothetical protein
MNRAAGSLPFLDLDGSGSCFASPIPYFADPNDSDLEIVTSSVTDPGQTRSGERRSRVTPYGKSCNRPKLRAGWSYVLGVVRQTDGRCLPRAAAESCAQRTAFRPPSVFCLGESALAGNRSRERPPCLRVTEALRLPSPDFRVPLGTARRGATRSTVRIRSLRSRRRRQTAP